MPDNIPTEEREQVKRIITRWCSTSYPIHVTMFVIVPILYLIGALLLFLWSESYWIILFYGVVGVTFLPFVKYHKILGKHLENRFIRRLTIKEKIALLHIAEDETIQEQKDAKYLLGAIAERELLRPSQPTESGDTLLRAATSTDNTLQDQLLRPTNNEPNDPMT